MMQNQLFNHFAVTDHGERMTNDSSKPKKHFFQRPWTEDRCGMVIDTVVTFEDGSQRSYFDGKTLEQLQEQYGPTLRICDLDTIKADDLARLRTEPVEIHVDDYIEALEVLPPDDLWVDDDINPGRETFKSCEHIQAGVTSVYAMVDGRYWTFTDEASVKPDYIVSRVLLAVEKESQENANRPTAG
jgi:hypothetical protein